MKRRRKLPIFTALRFSQSSFAFTISKEDTDKLGLGKFPIKLELLDGESLEVSDIITEGNLEGEFNAIQILQV